MRRPNRVRSLRTLLACAVAVVLNVAAAHAAPSGDPTIVQTDKGAIQGTLNGGMRVFLGIPFAAPPVGPLRFSAPKPATAWNGVREATQAASMCPQAGTATQNTTEDCLYLNVWAPVGASKAPVYVFLYGGGFIQGNAAAYDGSLLASSGKIVVVTLNYRTGIFGFLANSALANGGSATGNYGIEDQQAALHWVQRNIGNFGGEPRNVTLGGESAGAISTCANLAATQSAGTFVRAIVESGPCAVPLPTVSAVEAKHAAIPAQLGCTGSGAELAACLRSPSLTVQKILAVQQALARGTFTPSIEGDDIPVQPRTYLARIPLLLGGNFLEAGYTVLPKPPGSAAEYQAALQRDYGDQAAAIAAQYPYAKYPNGGMALATVETSSAPTPSISVCGDVTSWRLTRASGGAPIYAYEFNDPNASGVNGVPGPVHTAELPYLFPGGDNSGAAKALSPASKALSTIMLGYWTNYIKNGNPNGPGLPEWPYYNLITDVQQLVPNAVAPGTDVNAEHKCPFWNSLGRSL
jgi:para-nitrobenzyl esterase